MQSVLVGTMAWSFHIRSMLLIIILMWPKLYYKYYDFFWIIKIKKKRISRPDFHLTFGLMLIKVILEEPLLNRTAFIVLEFVAMHCLLDTEAEQVAIKAFYHIMFLCVPGNGCSGKLLVIALYDALSTGIANKLSLFHNVHKQKSLWSSISMKLE